MPIFLTPVNKLPYFCPTVHTRSIYLMGWWKYYSRNSCQFCSSSKILKILSLKFLRHIYFSLTCSRRRRERNNLRSHSGLKFDLLLELHAKGQVWDLRVKTPSFIFTTHLSKLSLNEQLLQRVLWKFQFRLKECVFILHMLVIILICKNFLWYKIPIAYPLKSFLM